MERAKLLQLIEQVVKDGRTELDLSEKGLTELPPQIGTLTDLASLNLAQNRLTSLPAEIGRLSNLRSLNLAGNQLTTLPAEIGHLTQLTELHLFENKLTELPSSLGELSHLTYLDLVGNQLTSLPPEISQLSHLAFLDLRDSRWPIPPEILEQSYNPAAIIDYYQEAQASSKRRLNEAKMLLLGEWGVGKTSLLKRLISDTYDRRQANTDGIDIQAWDIHINEETIRLNVWDFGAQEIYEATHQFFLTKRSLYLLVLNARQGEQAGGLKDWLQIIQRLAGNSPIIVVINKIDQFHLRLDRRGLQRKYPNIKAFVETSCATGEGISRLRAHIWREISRLEQVGDLLPSGWFMVKQQLEQMERDYLPYREYERLCRQEGIYDTQNQRLLIQLLHDLGIVLCFQDDIRLRATIILNPEWLTNGMYNILNAEILANRNGILLRIQLHSILDPVRYPPEGHLLIMDMMRKFELCYDFEGQYEEKFLIPSLLPIKQPAFTWNQDANLTFQYRYDVLPASIIPRFIMRMERYLLSQKVWRRGAVLGDADNQALVTANYQEKKIWLRVAGLEKTRKSFLSIIRSHFDHIHSTISGIQVREMVPWPDNPTVMVDYAYLRWAEREGLERHYFPEALREIDVKRLLDGIESARAQYERVERGRVREELAWEEWVRLEKELLARERQERERQKRAKQEQAIQVATKQERYTQLKKMKAVLESNAQQYVQRIRWLYIVGFVAFGTLFISAAMTIMQTIDILNPWTWLLGVLLVLALIAYLAARFNTNLAPDAFSATMLARQLKKEYQKFAFDVAEYERLEQELQGRVSS